MKKTYKKNIDTFVIFCAPKSLFSEAPTDQPNCTLISCPSCDHPMWFSEKKKEMIDN